MRSPVARRRRGNELGLGLMAVVVTGGGYLLLLLAEKPDIPADLWLFLAALLGLYVVAHIAVRRFAPRADATLLPIAFILNGIGFVTISRLDRDLARVQAIWTAVGVARVRAHPRVRAPRAHARALQVHVPAHRRGRAAPAAAPGSGARDQRRAPVGAVRAGELPAGRGGEGATRRLLRRVPRRQARAARGREPPPRAADAPRPEAPRPAAPRVGRLDPRDGPPEGPRVVAPLLRGVRGDALHRDRTLGVPRRRVRDVRRGRRRSRTSCSRTCRTASSWADPWSVAQTTGYQLVQSLYAFGTGRLRGHRSRAREPAEDPQRVDRLRVLRRSARSSACIGTVAICMLFLLFVGSGFRIAVQAERPFSKLFAAGLTTIVGVQTFVIIGGVIRVIPLTGVTLPFISYGGSSLVANFVLVALLLRISDETVEHQEMPRPVATARTGARRRRRGARPAGRPVNRAIRQRRHRGERADPRARRAAHLPAGRRRRQPRQTTRGTCARCSATSTGRAARSSPPTARSSPTSVPTRRRRLQVPAHVPARRPVRADQRRTSRSVVGNTGVEESYNDVLTGRDAGHLRLSDLGGIFSGKNDTGNVVLSLSQTRAAGGARRARRATRLGRRARHAKTGEIVAMFSNPTFDPNPLAEPRPGGRASRVQRAQRRPDEARRCRARTARSTRRARRSRSSPARARSTPGSRHRSSPSIPFVELDPAPGLGRTPLQLRRRGRAAATSPRASCTRATRRSARSGSTSATRSCPRSTTAASASARRRSTSARRGRRASAPRRAFDDDQAVLRQGRDRPAGRRGHPARDGARGRGHRERRRDHGAARGPRDPGLRRHGGEDDREQAVEDAASRRRTRRALTDMMVQVVAARHRHRRADPGGHGRGQDRYRAERRPEPRRTRGSSRSRRPRAPQYAVVGDRRARRRPSVATRRPVARSPRRSPSRCSQALLGV